MAVAYPNPADLSSFHRRSLRTELVEPIGVEFDEPDVLAFALATPWGGLPYPLRVRLMLP